MMTEDKIRKFLRAAAEVDGGCGHCFATVVQAFVAAWPEWEYMAESVWTGEGYAPGGWRDECAFNAASD